MEVLKGTILDIVFRNEENGYTVAELDSGEALITVVGLFPLLQIGQTFRLHGEYVNHDVYGEQFSFTDYEEVMPTTADGIRAFLASGMITGIGPKTANAIVEKYGEDTLNIMNQDIDRLLEIPGIGPKNLIKIKESYADQRAFAEISMFLKEYDIPAAAAAKLYQVYGEATIPVITQDPYRLVEEVRGIGFRKADEIARKMGVGEDSASRIKAAVRHLLYQHVNNGDTYALLELFLEETSELLDLPRERIHEVVFDMAISGDVKVDQIDGTEVVYLYSYFEAEQLVAAKLQNMMLTKAKTLTADLDYCLAVSEEEMGKNLSLEQKQAVKNSVESSVSIITGGPGTGKTTVIGALITIFKNSGLSVVLAAPTGRAAKRMTEATGEPASTIHRLLGYYYDDGMGEMKFAKNWEDPIEGDVLIVDEASMIDLMLMKGLLDAVRSGTRLILTGDVDQLPSVGAGNVLSDLVDSGLVGVSVLKEIFRQAGESRIIVNAHRINQGDPVEVNGKDSDFFFLEQRNERDLAELIVALATRRLPKFYHHLDSVRDIQVITPVHKGAVGTDNLNNLLQMAINPPSAEKQEKRRNGMIFREGDKVMQIRNDYQLKWSRPGVSEEMYGIFNGDMGFIHRIDNENGQTTVVFDDERYVTYDNQQLEELALAYAITVHKSQGSEFPVIVMPISYFPPMLASRNLLYTAVTRGKEGVVLAGNYQVLNRMIENDRIRLRLSGLSIRLGNLVPYQDA